MEILPLNKTTYMVSSGTQRYVYWGWGRKYGMYIVKIGFTGQPDFVVRYLATKNGLSNKNLFRFQGNIVKVNRICENMCNVFAPTFYFVKNS
jgi:hypothetical protein